MFRTHSRKIRRDITSRRTRTLLVSLSVFVGVLGVVALTTLGQLMTRQLEKDLNPAEMAMFRVYVDPPIGPPLDTDANLAVLREQAGVTRVEGQAVYEFQWRKAGDAGFTTGQLFAYSEPYGQIRLEPVRLVAGAYPVEGQKEIAIERRMADRYDLHIGDNLYVRVNGVGQQVMRIVGLVFQPYLYVGSGDGSTSAFATYADAQHIVGFSGFSSFYVRFKDYPTARQDAGEFRRILRNYTPYKIVFYLLDNPQNNVFLVGVRQFARLLVILSIMALIVASFLVTNVISSIVAEQHQQIGALKALGATRRDILIIYLGIAAVYGLIGTLPALAVGIPLGQQAAEKAAPLANTILENTTPPLIVPALGLLLGVGVPVLAAIIPVLHASTITIVEAMTDQGIRATYGKGPLAYVVGHLPLSLPVVQALNNVFRHKARLVLTFFTLTLAVATFMGVFAVFNTLNDVVDNVRTKLNRQVAIDPAQIEVRDLMQQIFLDEQIQEIQPGVAVELEAELPPSEEQTENSGSGTEAGDGIERLYVTGLDTTTDLLNVVLTEGTAWTDDPQRRGIVITPAMAEKFGKTVGDTLHLISPNNTADFEIIGIAEFPIETAFMQWQQLADFVGDLRDAPTPNAYWEQVQIEMNDGGEAVFDPNAVWAVGIDERVGQFLVPGYNPDEPGAIISRAVADEGDFQVGDSITLRPADSSLLDTLIEDPSKTYPVLAVVDADPQQVRLLARDAPPDVLTDNPALIALYWAELASLVHLDYQELTPQTFRVDLANPEESLNSAYTAPSAVYRNQVSFTDRIVQTMLSVGLVMSVAASLMAVVGGIGLLTITSISVFERQREIGVMRSVGASSRLILQQFMLEGLFVGLGAWLAGLPLSYVLGDILIRTIPFRDVVAFHYTYLAPLIGVGGMLLLTTVATLYPSITASRKTVSEILRYQ
jgi:ABC-type antimicrobial peptide transport system permease subunit